MSTPVDSDAPLLEIEHLHVKVGGQPVLRGVSLRGARRRGARHHGPERLGQEHARARAGGPPGLRDRLGQRDASRAAICSRSRPRSARAPDCSSASSTRSRSPASTTPICSRPRSTPRGARAACPSSMRSSSWRWCASKMKLMQIDESFLGARRQRRLLGRREEAQRDPADAGARAEARDAG